MKIGLVSVFVSDPLDAFKYYTEVLGFVKKMYVPEAYLAIVASAEEPNGTSLMLEPNTNPIAKTYQTDLYKAGIPAIVFTANDIYGEYEKLKTKGVVFRNEPKKTEYGIEGVFEDTFGNLIQLYQA
jgi:catechol 2,3-dioxygenase-like lactoylglutathione lyase family enzyme